MNFKTFLASKNACSDSIEWAGDKTPEQAYASCEQCFWCDIRLSKLESEYLINLRSL